MKHIIQFSGGLASAYVAWRIVEEYGKHNCILLFHDTKSEHKDNHQFKIDVCNYLGTDMLEIIHGLSLWDLIVKQNCLPSTFIPFCNRILKTEQGLKLLKKFKDKFKLYNGFGISEKKRRSGAIKACNKYGWEVHSPLIEENISDEVVYKVIRKEWGIKIPEPYHKGFAHSNCLPCFKGGQKSFKQVWTHYPEEFEKAKWAEKKIGNTCFKRGSKKRGNFRRVTLTQLEKEWEREKSKNFVQLPATFKPIFNHADEWEQLNMFEVNKV